MVCYLFSLYLEGDPIFLVFVKSFVFYILTGMSLPIAHVEDSWQMAEFYNNKVM